MPSREYLALLMENQRSMYAMICSLLGNSERAQDVLQETNLVLWEKAAEYDRSRPFKPWALRFAHNQVLAFRQKTQRDRLVFDDQMLEDVRERTIVATETLENQLKSLDACLEKLPSQQRELIRRRYFEGIKLKQIAEDNSQSANSLAAMLFRARQALLRCMKTQVAAEPES